MSRRNSLSLARSIFSDAASSTSRSAEATRIIYFGEVVGIDDALSLGRIRVHIPDIDLPLGQHVDITRLPWCSYLFATNIQHVPKLGETVAVILENPWKKSSGRWWIGPITEDGIISVPIDSVAISARDNNSIQLSDTGDIDLSTDKTKSRLDAEATISLSKEHQEARVAANDIILETTANQGGEEFAVPYGERVVELMRFILQTMKSHSHPPNAPPTPDFFVQADRYLNDLEEWLINKNVRTRGN